MRISDEGTCIVWGDCLATKNNRWFFSREKIAAMQKEFIQKHDCFLSGGRLYVKTASHIIDAVTGTLFLLSGHCVHREADLYVDIHDKNSDKDAIYKFVSEKY